MLKRIWVQYMHYNLKYYLKIIIDFKYLCIWYYNLNLFKIIIFIYLMNSLGPYIHTPLANAFAWLTGDDYAEKHYEFKST